MAEVRDLPTTPQIVAIRWQFGAATATAQLRPRATGLVAGP